MTKTAIITGAAGGIGGASVALLAAQGWEVLAVDIRAAPPSGCIEFLREDVSTPRGAQRVLAAARRRWERLGALVNNAAIQVCKPLIETSPEEWDLVMGSNTRSVYLMTRAAHPLLLGGGSIVNVSSVHAHASSASIGAYAASKGAVLALTRALAVEFAADGIRVNALLPGAVDTPMLRAGLKRGPGSEREGLDRLAAATPQRRIGRPEELAASILFLADSARSSFMTGQALVVDGGVTARLSSE